MYSQVCSLPLAHGRVSLENALVSLNVLPYSSNLVPLLIVGLARWEPTITKYRK